MLNRFQFSPEGEPTFKGAIFYAVYEDAEFVKEKEHVITILTRGYQLGARIQKLKEGDSLVVDGMYISNNIPLMVKKAGKDVMLENHEFTINRLSGFVAAYAYKHYKEFPELHIPDAHKLGLSWDIKNKEKAKLYLSAVRGTEHFCDQFSYYPLLCSLRKLFLKNIPPHVVLKMAKVRNEKGERMIHLLLTNKEQTLNLWSVFPESVPHELEGILATITK